MTKKQEEEIEKLKKQNKILREAVVKLSKITISRIGRRVAEKALEDCDGRR